MLFPVERKFNPILIRNFSSYFIPLIRKIKFNYRKNGLKFLCFYKQTSRHTTTKMFFEFYCLKKNFLWTWPWNKKIRQSLFCWMVFCVWFSLGFEILLELRLIFFLPKNESSFWKEESFIKGQSLVSDFDRIRFLFKKITLKMSEKR